MSLTAKKSTMCYRVWYSPSSNGTQMDRTVLSSALKSNLRSSFLLIPVTDNTVLVHDNALVDAAVLVRPDSILCAIIPCTFCRQYSASSSTLYPECDHYVYIRGQCSLRATTPYSVCRYYVYICRQ